MFFHAMPLALPLYEILRHKLLTWCPDTTLKVQKSQITFKVKYGYVFASLRRMQGCPKVFIIVSEAEQLDDEFMGWLREAHDFALIK